MNIHPEEWSWYAVIATFPIAILTLVFAVIPWLDLKFEKRRLARSFGADSFDEQQIGRALSGYVQPDCSQLDPSGEDDSRHMFSVRSALVPEVDKLLSDRHDGKHVLLLADSGMGKTSFLLHYYARNRRRKAKDQKRIAVVPLGRPDVEERIASIESKRDTVIFLDAFDEDTDAIRDHRGRLDELMKLCSDFKRVVVTCRTQFFPSDEEVPRETGVARVGPRRTGEGRIYRFYKLYLAPFNDLQVNSYIAKHFAFWNVRHRFLARRIVRAIPELSIRPMLLALVPDLVTQNVRVRNLYDLYEFMIESWLDREKDWIPKDVLRNFSELLSIDMFINRSRRKMERMPMTELADFIEGIEWI